MAGITLEKIAEVLENNVASINNFIGLETANGNLVSVAKLEEDNSVTKATLAQINSIIHVADETHIEPEVPTEQEQV